MMISADPDSKSFASMMVGSAEVNQTILEETVESAMSGRIHESGRTACGSIDNIHQPRVRMPKAVELTACPVGDVTGFWHTHVTRDQFRDPEHSLPDMSNVLFEGAGASVVTGLDTSHVMYSPSDVGAAQDSFRNVIGADVRSTRDVKDAITSGNVPDPPGTRRRLFEELSPLFSREQTPLVDRQVIEDNIHAVPPTMSAPGEGAIAYELIECAMTDPRASFVSSDAIGRIHNTARAGSDVLRVASRRVASAGFDEAIGVIVGTAISHYFFGRKR